MSEFNFNISSSLYFISPFILWNSILLSTFFCYCYWFNDCIIILFSSAKCYILSTSYLFYKVSYLLKVDNYFIFLLDSYYFFIIKSIISCNYDCLAYNYNIFPVVSFMSFIFKDYNSYIEGDIWFLMHLLHSTLCTLLVAYFIPILSFYIYFYFW